MRFNSGFKVLILTVKTREYSKWLVRAKKLSIFQMLIYSLSKIRIRQGRLFFSHAENILLVP